MFSTQSAKPYTLNSSGVLYQPSNPLSDTNKKKLGVLMFGPGVHIRAIDIDNQWLRFHIGNRWLGSTKCRDEIRTVENTSHGSDAAHQGPVLKKKDHAPPKKTHFVYTMKTPPILKLQKKRQWLLNICFFVGSQSKASSFMIIFHL